MIDPKELRLGNYYYSVVVKDLRQIWIVSRGENTMQPITITNAVMEACGARKVNGVYEIGDLQFYLYDTGLQLLAYCGWNGELDDFNNCEPVKHLHQLQNLYYTLTDEELEIDETKLKQAL